MIFIDLLIFIGILSAEGAILQLYAIILDALGYFSTRTDLQRLVDKMLIHYTFFSLL